jgi:CRP/FNR family transcriptional regulator, transcriptional activator FtrB
MRTEDVSEIRRLALFRTISESGFDTMMRGAYLQTFPPAMELISEGGRADFLHVVVEGDIELFAGWNGREATLFTMGRESTFILAATITDHPYLMSARTIGRSRIALIPSEDVRGVFANDSAFACAVVDELASRFRESIRHSKNIKLRTSVERVANYLLAESAASGEQGFVDLPHDKRLIASFLGMTPENLSRAFGALKPFGVQVDGSRITITRPEDLEGLAKPASLIDGPDPSVLRGSAAEAVV